MLLARGDVQERAFGVTIAALARKYGSAQLTVRASGRTYDIVFRDGLIVAASSSHPEDRMSAIALGRGWISPTTCAVIEQVRSNSPAADELEVCSVLGELTPETTRLLDRRAIAQRASRVIGLDSGTYTLSTDITLVVREGNETHLGGIVFQGALLQLSESRLEDIVNRLGSRFELAPAHVGELEYLGFGRAEAQLIRALLEGVTFDRLQQLRGIEPPHAYAAVYALVACGLATGSQRLARGTQNPITPTATVRAPSAPVVTERMSDEEAATAAFLRGEVAMRTERIADAIADFEYAARLVPAEKRYTTALAWARFCGSTDKAAAANETRKILGRAAAHHDAPIEAIYYLGMLERMLERPARAEEHFRDVLERMPNHVEAATELRFLLRRKR